MTTRLTLLAWTFATALLGLGWASSASSSPIPAVSFTGAAWSQPGSFSLGFEFTLATDIKVTHLGYYDRGGDGLSVSAQVGIFDSATSSLVSGASITVPSGTGALLVGDGPQGYYRYSMLSAPVTLSSGATYRVAGVSTTNGYAYTGFTGLSSAAGITLGPGYYAGSTSLVYPGSHTPFGNNIYGAGSFLFTSVPEPVTLALLGFGLAGLALGIRRKAR